MTAFQSSEGSVVERMMLQAIQSNAYSPSTQASALGSFMKIKNKF